MERLVHGLVKFIQVCFKQLFVLNQEEYIEKCRRLIEKKLAWGSSEYWQNQDYERLSEQIFEATNVTLSISTLKRLWGKVRYTSTPNLSTLNALAQFAGYKDWRSFLSADVQPTITHTENETASEAIVLPGESRVKVGPVKWSKAFWIGSIAVFLSLMALWAFHQNAKRLTYNNIRFTSAPTTLVCPIQ